MNIKHVVFLFALLIPITSCAANEQTSFVPQPKLAPTPLPSPRTLSQSKVLAPPPTMTLSECREIVRVFAMTPLPSTLRLAQLKYSAARVKSAKTDAELIEVVFKNCKEMQELLEWWGEEVRARKTPPLL